MCLQNRNVRCISMSYSVLQHKSRRDTRSSDSQDFADSTQHSTVLKMHTTINTIEKASSNNYSETTTYPVMLYLLHSYVVYCNRTVAVYSIFQDQVTGSWTRDYVDLFDVNCAIIIMQNRTVLLILFPCCWCRQTFVFFSHILNLE